VRKCPSSRLPGN